jgi:hypothetical protein
MAEIELSVLNRQCLNRCIPSQAVLAHETQTWLRNEMISKPLSIGNLPLLMLASNSNAFTHQSMFDTLPVLRQSGISGYFRETNLKNLSQGVRK